MTQDEVIALAREAGDDWEHSLREDQEFLIRFAARIEAKLTERLLAGAGEPVAWMCSDPDLMHKGYQRFSPTLGGDWNIPVYTADQVAAAVLRDREECAKVCETFNSDELGCLDACAAAIRARGNT